MILNAIPSSRDYRPVLPVIVVGGRRVPTACHPRLVLAHVQTTTARHTTVRHTDRSGQGHTETRLHGRLLALLLLQHVNVLGVRAAVL